MPSQNLENLSGYIVSKLGCAHPFRVSRILVLAYWKFEELYQERLTSFRLGGFEAGFYIEKLSDIMRGEDKRSCFKKDEARKCFIFESPIPRLKESERIAVDWSIEIAKNLSDYKLNRLVIRDPRYMDLLKKGETCI